LPLEGKPDNFAGLVGEYRIAAGASPTEVNLGDPITLTITLTASSQALAGEITLPPLSSQKDLAEGFKIPAIELVYFDTGIGEYRVARSEPIPITVRQTKRVTYRDIEGADVSVISKKEVEALTEGIAFNYEDLSVLVNQRYGLETVAREPAWTASVSVPFFLFIVFASAVKTSRARKTSPQARRAKRAFGELSRRLRSLNRRQGCPPNCSAE